MLAVPIVLFASMLVTGATVTLYEISKDIKKLEEKKEREQSVQIVNQVEELNKINDSLSDPRSQGSVNALLKNGLEPSKLLVYDDNTTREDGFKLNRYNSAIIKFMETDKINDPNCTQLAATGLISSDDCVYISAKEASMKFIGFNDGVAEVSIEGNLREEVENLGNNSSTENNIARVNRGIESKKSVEKKKELINRYIENINSEVISKDYDAAISVAIRLSQLSPIDSFNNLKSLMNIVNGTSLISDTQKRLLGKNYIKSLVLLNNKEYTKSLAVSGDVNMVWARTKALQINAVQTEIKEELVSSKTSSLSSQESIDAISAKIDEQLTLIF